MSIFFSFDDSGEPHTTEVSISCGSLDNQIAVSTFFMTVAQFEQFCKDGRKWFKSGDDKLTQVETLQELFEQYINGLISFSEFVAHLAEFQMAYETRQLKNN